MPSSRQQTSAAIPLADESHMRMAFGVWREPYKIVVARKEGQEGINQLKPRVSFFVRPNNKPTNLRSLRCYYNQLSIAVDTLAAGSLTCSRFLFSWKNWASVICQ